MSSSRTQGGFRAAAIPDPPTKREVILRPIEVSTRTAIESPDGTRIVFMSNRDGDWDLYVMDADGTNVQQLTDTPGPEWGPAWSPV